MAAFLWSIWRNGKELGLFRVLLSREFNPLKSIMVETVNGLPVSESPYSDVLKQAGFRDNFKVFILN